MATIRYGSLVIPLIPGWKDESKIVVVRQEASGKDSAGFRPNIVISVETVSDNETLEEFKSRILPQLREAIPGLALDRAGPELIGPWNAYTLEYRFRVQATSLSQIQVYLKVGNSLCALTHTNLTEEIELTRNEFHQMVAQFRAE